MTALAELFGVAADRLTDLTVHQFARQLVPVPVEQTAARVCDSKTIKRFFGMSSPPVCPVCLVADRPYERLLWGFRPAPVCFDHRCLLTRRCSDCRRTWRRDRLDLCNCRCGAAITITTPETVSAEALRLLRRFYEALTDGVSLLPESSVAAGFWWAERLASAASRTPQWLQQVRDRYTLPAQVEDSTAAWLTAAEMLDGWPSRFLEFLHVFQTLTRHRTSVTGLSRSFGLLLRDAAHLEQLGVSTPADVLRAELLQHYTHGHLTVKCCLFRDRKHRHVLAQRPWITQTKADKTLGLKHGAVAELLRRNVLEGHLQSAGNRSVGLVSRESVRVLKDQLAEAFSVNQAAGRLGIGRSRIFELIRAELLPCAVRTIAGWRIPRSSVTELAELYRSLPVWESSDPSDWIPAREATRRFGRCGLTFVRLLELIRDGHVRGCREAHVTGWGGLRVPLQDLQSARPEISEKRDRCEGYPLNRLGRVLIPGRPLKESVLRKWIRAGLLQAERRGRIWHVALDEVERFRSTYCLADDACRMLRISRSTLARRETAGEISAVYSRRTHSGAGASVFRRDDVLRMRAE
ncbi:MAG: TniQ family protein [Planctomycetes bacterium]|nr:TniQ family protein [Planctomycetota bacterium]